MTENMAGRGEGLADRLTESIWAISDGQHPDKDTLRNLIRNILAAAPAGTAPHHVTIDYAAKALEAAGKSYSFRDAQVVARTLNGLLALATPSPQAPAGDRTFSPTEQTPSGMATASANLNVADLKPLKDVCDRDWKDESPLQIICIAANAIYWRDVELSVLKESPDYANGFNAGRESLSAPLTPYGERIADCLRTAVEWNDDYMRINKLYGKVDWVEWAKKLLTGNLEKRVPAATQEPAGSGALTVEQEHAQWHEQNGVTEPGSPRKVGEDGAQVTLETVFDEEHQESKWRNAVAEQLNTLLTRAKYCADTTNDESDKDVERATLAIVERVATFEHIRPSSAPVGEQPEVEGAGSGALREALRQATETLRVYTAMIPDQRIELEIKQYDALLSLPSPIEPPPGEVTLMNSHRQIKAAIHDGCLVISYKDKRDGIWIPLGELSKLRELINEPTGTQSCPHCGKDVPHEHFVDRKGNVVAQPTPQASLEVREKLKLIKSCAEDETASDGYRMAMADAHRWVTEALAPSRQGAGGK